MEVAAIVGVVEEGRRDASVGQGSSWMGRKEAVPGWGGQHLRWRGSCGEVSCIEEDGAPRGSRRRRG